MKKDDKAAPGMEQVLADQGLAAWIAHLNQVRQIPLHEAIEGAKAALTGQEKAFADALGEIDKVRTAIGSPENILGSDKTKHGEIAEMAEIGIRNARSLLRGMAPDAAKVADRFAAEDYTIGGTSVQSKFINGVNQGMQHVLDHADRYPDFGTADGGYYHIPNDQYETIKRVLNGDTDGLNARSVTAIQEKVRQLEQMKGRPFDDLVRPASHNYAEIQQGRIHGTLDRHENDLRSENEAIKQEIKKENQENVDAAKAKTAPTLGEMGKATAVGAAVGAGLQLTMALYQKWAREGKPPTRMTAADWQEVGGATFRGAVTGGISAAALYGLTNYASLSAPFAGAVVSSGRAVASLAKQYHAGEISFDEFTDLSLIASTEAGIAAAGAALGQALIPIPILGAFIGSAVAGLAASHVKRVLNEKHEAFARRLQVEFDAQVALLTDEHRRLLGQFEAELLRLGDLTAAAFDLNMNARLLLLRSAALAEAHGVPEAEIMRTAEDVDAFMLGAMAAKKGQPA